MSAAVANVAVVLWMHGLGDTGDGWSHLQQEFSQPRYSHVKWEFPNAPISPVTCNGGFRMNSWFDILDIPLTSEPEAVDLTLDVAVRKVHAMIQKHEDAGVPAGRIVLGGFSQGAALALTSGLRYPRSLAGIAAFSGWIPSKRLLAKDTNEESRKTPVLWCHGTGDQIVLYDCAKTGVPALESAGINVELKSYPGMEHASCYEEIEDLKKWIAARLPA
eukprot:jgi/Mesvir1/11462/Mv04608-RA.1